MLFGHAENHFIDDIAFAIALIPIVVLSAIIVASILESKYRSSRIATIQVRADNRSLPRR